ncbi:MAG: UDP-N-acetylglucosamine 4,6-dehydratase (inverting) [Candidatus Parcubacteria bacterium]|nr:UDP-N-acetylglucosamine 4,6-dehydratase (inverting) [Candidatus Parcubacteria bacterium]
MNEAILKGKTVLITGGTGSFGKNFAKFVLTKCNPKKVIIFSRDEFKQHQMQQEVKDSRIRFFIGDIRDLPRLQRAFSGVDVVVHAAALKQVPAMEYNPFEAVKTNIIGTQNVIEAALDQKVGKAVLISTDKAVYPINLYGSTKLAAEKLFCSANMYSGDKIPFSVVRYGNVIGSRGSIIETILKNGENIKTVDVTDPDMTRFWLALPQSFQLVLFALKNMEGREIFIPKIPSMKIGDLFDAMAPLAKKKIIGLRPGEKMHEILITENDINTYSLGDYFVILPDISFNEGMYKKYYAKGKKVKEGFSYTSDKNDIWLTKNEIKKLVTE